MSELIIENIKPELIERLEARAKQHGRSLQAELKHILEMAVLEKPAISEEIEAIVQTAEKMRSQIVRQAGGDPSDLKPIDRERAAAALEKLRALKKIAPGAMSIREMREEGRRF